MNTVIETLLAHRSIRSFNHDPVADNHIIAAVRAGQAASTSSAVQAYCVIQITDATVRAEIAELAGNQRSVETCGAFFLICGDSRRHRLAAERAGEPYDPRLEAFLVGVVDAALFAQNMAVAFESLGYGICYIGGVRNDLDRLDRLLGLPHGVYPLFGMCVGVPAKRPAARPRLPIEAVLMRDRYIADAEMSSHMRHYDDAYGAYLAERAAPAAQVALAWTGRIAELHHAPRREHDAAYYRAKGARLD